jgi:hypothetical protein
MRQKICSLRERGEQKLINRHFNSAAISTGDLGDFVKRKYQYFLLHAQIDQPTEHFTKGDMKYAYIHGILARPPPDAGRLARLWYQAKELFVRWPGPFGVASAATFSHQKFSSEVSS